MHDPYPSQAAPVLYQPPAAVHGAVEASPVPALTLYQVPVPGAVEVTLPNGQVAWARPVAAELAPAPAAHPARRAAEPLPVWVKAACMVPLALSGAGLICAYAIRIAAPALEGLVEFLDSMWKFALAAAVIFGVIAVRVRSRLAGTGHAAPAAAPEPAPILIQGTGGTGGRWASKGGTGVHIGKLTINR